MNYQPSDKEYYAEVYVDPAGYKYRRKGDPYFKSFLSYMFARNHLVEFVVLMIPKQKE